MLTLVRETVNCTYYCTLVVTMDRVQHYHLVSPKIHENSARNITS